MDDECGSVVMLLSLPNSVVSMAIWAFISDNSARNAESVDTEGGVDPPE